MQSRIGLPDTKTLFEFHALLGARRSALEAEANPPNALLARYDEKPRESITDELRKHTVWLWLARNGDFAKAFEICAQELARERKGARRAIAELGLIQAIVLVLAVGQGLPEDWKPQTFTASRRQQALSNANVVARDIEELASRIDWDLCFRLRPLLDQYCNELTQERRRDYSGPDARQRYLLTQCAEFLIPSLGARPHVIVEMLAVVAHLLGFKVAHRSLQRYTDTAKANLRRRFPALYRPSKKHRAKSRINRGGTSATGSRPISARNVSRK